MRRRDFIRAIVGSAAAWPLGDDAAGTFLPDVEAALSYAEYTIRELQKKSGYNDTALKMIVKDEARQTVLSLPFFPGC